MASQWNRKTAFPGSLRDCVTVKTRSTKRKPFSLWQPNEIFRHKTRVRMVRSAWLLVGSTPSLRTNVHSDSSNRSTFAQNLAVFPSGHDRPCRNRRPNRLSANASGGATQPGQSGFPVPALQLKDLPIIAEASAPAPNPLVFPSRDLPQVPLQMGPAQLAKRSRDQCVGPLPVTAVNARGFPPSKAFKAGLPRLKPIWKAACRKLAIPQAQAGLLPFFQPVSSKFFTAARLTASNASA